MTKTTSEQCVICHQRYDKSEWRFSLIMIVLKTTFISKKSQTWILLHTCTAFDTCSVKNILRIPSSYRIFGSTCACIDGQLWGPEDIVLSFFAVSALREFMIKSELFKLNNLVSYSFLYTFYQLIELHMIEVELSANSFILSNTLFFRIFWVVFTLHLSINSISCLSEWCG